MQRDFSFRVVNSSSCNLDKWTTYCRLFVYNRDKKADYITAVLPGNFEVTRVIVKYVSSNYPVASRYWRVRDIPAYYLYQVRMQLTSPDQPDIRSLNCFKKWATPRAKQYPTLAEIRQALGNLIELRPSSTTSSLESSAVSNL